jgi:hypothetical protein
MGCLVYITTFIQIVFIILKLFSIIKWTWLAVFIPLWAFIILIILSTIIQTFNDWMEGY